MEDQGIVELFFDRSEQAIVETDKKYGGYCYTIAYHILASREDSEESVSDTYFSAWNTIPPRKPTLLQAFLGKSPGISPLTAGGSKVPRSGVARR